MPSTIEWELSNISIVAIIRMLVGECIGVESWVSIRINHTKDCVGTHDFFCCIVIYMGEGTPKKLATGWMTKGLEFESP
jgi:hypothetical protein